VWERGLKRIAVSMTAATSEVAPRVGAWIETMTGGIAGRALAGRSPCGSVD